MSKVKQAYALATELLAEVEDGSIDFDEAYDNMLATYAILSIDDVEQIFHNVMEVVRVRNWLNF